MRRRPLIRLLLAASIGIGSGIASGCGRSPSVADAGGRPADQLPPKAALNRKAHVDRPGPFRLLLGGHAYGNPAEGSPRPASTLVAARERILAEHADLFVLLGDSFHRTPSADDDPTLAFLDTLPMPVVNAPGNHDLVDRETYVRRFGATQFEFDFAGCRFVVLDTEARPWDLDAAQVGRLGAAIDAVGADPRLRGLYVFGHRPVFGWGRRTIPAGLGGNDVDAIGLIAGALRKHPASGGFETEIVGRLHALALRKPVVWAAGDFGAFPAGVHLFIERRDARSPLWIGVGCGDRDTDSLVRIDHDADGTVRASRLALVPGGDDDAAGYGLDSWLARLAEPERNGIGRLRLWTEP